MKLPPLNALRAFEAAGRNRSFLVAAKSLHVSAASISRYIKVLEAHLGQQLFIRNANGVALTESGEEYLAAIQPALANISATTKAFRHKQQKKKLTIIAIPAIAETWLVSQLWSFQQQYTNTQINLILDDQPVTLAADEATVWLTPSETQISEHTQQFAMAHDQLTLVCNPALANTLTKPADIFKHPLLIDIDWEADWNAWFKEADIRQSPDAEVIHFDRYSMVINAALAGTGVAIGHTALLETYINNGTLIAPFSITAPTHKQFYAVIAKNTRREAVKQFANWFMQEDYFTCSE